MSLLDRLIPADLNPADAMGHVKRASDMITSILDLCTATNENMAAISARLDAIDRNLVARQQWAADQLQGVSVALNAVRHDLGGHAAKIDALQRNVAAALTTLEVETAHE